MDPSDYEAWYGSPRGQWIGNAEHALLTEMLKPEPGETLLDVGCGTGHFSRRFAQGNGLRVTGVDIDQEWLAYAQARSDASIEYVRASALDLPFPERSFDLTVSVTALCFIAPQRQALAEMLRVTRRRFALGLLNQHSLLYWQKGRRGGSGAYHGAHWHTAGEVKRLFSGMPVTDLSIRSCVFLPEGNWFSRAVEKALPTNLPWGGFLAVSGNVIQEM